MQRLAILISIVVFPALALAQTAATFDMQEMKFTSGVENKMPADDKTTFATGDRAWVWLKLRPTRDTATISFKWSWDGKDVWAMDPKPVKLGRTWFYKTVDQPGEWKVTILDNNDTVVKEATITVTGEPVYKKATAPTTADAAPTTADAASATADPAPTAGGAEPAATVAESENVGVVQLKLATEIKDSNPVTPGTSFTQGDKVYTWVKLHVKVPETQVKLRWYVNDAAVYTSDPITVREAAGWRTWMYKTVDTAGSWKVEVIDTDDKTVHAENFTVN